MTTRTHEGLSPDLIFEPDGHLTELCLTCVSDGQLSLVPEGALDHLDACEPCGRRLGEAALLSVEIGEALRAAPRVVASVVPAVVRATPAAFVSAPPTPRRVRRPLPIAAIAAALLVAVVTAGPALFDVAHVAHEVPSAISGIFGLLLLSARVGATVLRASSSGLAPLLVKCASALVFVVLGLQVARVRSRARSWQGGVQ